MTVPYILPQCLVTELHNMTWNLLQQGSKAWRPVHVP